MTARCIRCGRLPAATPALNIWTRKGLVHVGCVPEPVTPADRDPLTGKHNPETDVRDPLTGEWHTR